jgi:hypothetical protein
MLQEVLDWGVESDFISGDSWYSCVKNKNYQRGFMFALESNRLVFLKKGTWC